MLVWRMEVNKWNYASRRNWLELGKEFESLDHLLDDDEIYTLYFGDYKSVSEYIDKITVGHRQYWADTNERTDGDEQQLEYHNGTEWDSEIHLNIKKVRVHESLIETIKGDDCFNI